MFVFALQPGAVTTREAVLAEAAARLGLSPLKIREKVQQEINSAIAEGTLIEEAGRLHTRNHVTSWILDVHRENDSATQL